MAERVVGCCETAAREFVTTEIEIARRGINEFDELIIG